MKSLTKRQQQVLELDQQGLRPSQIGVKLGLRLSRVSNIKIALRKLGYDVQRYRQSNLPKAVTFEMPPDDDEPETVIERCPCGLILPCYHGNDAISLTGSSAGAAADAGDFQDDPDYPESAWTIKRRENRVSAAQKLAGADPKGQRTAQARQGVDGPVHVPR